MPGDMSGAVIAARPERAGQRAFVRFKRLFDILLALAALPLVGGVALVLLALNPLGNPGPLIYRQARMGRGLVPFTALKFRTMQPAPAVTRGARDPVERARITPLGAFLRRTRIDELPQFWNILAGEMSFIGPRPDYLPHAREFLALLPDYAARYAVLPGLSGLAQVRLGYVEGLEETRAKVAADLEYIRSAGPWLDLKILALTVVTVLTSRGR